MDMPKRKLSETIDPPIDDSEPVPEMDGGTGPAVSDKRPTSNDVAAALDKGNNHKELMDLGFKLFLDSMMEHDEEGATTYQDLGKYVDGDYIDEKTKETREHIRRIIVAEWEDVKSGLDNRFAGLNDIEKGADCEWRPSGNPEEDLRSHIAEVYRREIESLDREIEKENRAVENRLKQRKEIVDKLSGVVSEP